MTDHTPALGLFPGQGSQKVGMGKQLYSELDLAREYFDCADKALGFSLSKICFEGPPEKLTETAVAQPAILTASTILFSLAERSPQKNYKIVAAAGHSLGEYSALVAAGALAFEDAVLLVHKRGRYMQEAVPLGKGTMLAVLGKDLPELEAALAKVTAGVAEVANINAPGQIVVAGDKRALDEFVTHLGAAKVMELQVSAPFHCRLMQPAADNLARDLDALTIQDAAFPIYANFSAAPVSRPAEIRQALKQQVCGRVRWVECMQNAIAQHKPALAIEFGEGNVLSGMLKRIAPDIARRSAA